MSGVRTREFTSLLTGKRMTKTFPLEPETQAPNAIAEAQKLLDTLKFNQQSEYQRQQDVARELTALRSDNEKLRAELERPMSQDQIAAAALDAHGGQIRFKVERDVNGRLARLDGGAIVFDVHRDSANRITGMTLRKRETGNG